MLNKFSIILFVLFTSLNASSQNNALQLNDAVITISNGAVLNINQIDNTGITGNTGYIVSEGETNSIAWNTNGETQTYSFPFGTQNGDFIPVIIEKTSGGTCSGNEGSIMVSTYPTAFDNRPYPSNSNGFFGNVTNMNGADGTDNSINVVDRFWMINFNNFNINPIVSATFTYDAIGANNDISGLQEENLVAQQWNGSSWIQPTSGIADPANDQVKEST